MSDPWFEKGDIGKHFIWTYRGFPSFLYPMGCPHRVRCNPTGFRLTKTIAKRDVEKDKKISGYQQFHDKNDDHLAHLLGESKSTMLYTLPVNLFLPTSRILRATSFPKSMLKPHSRLFRRRCKLTMECRYNHGTVN